MADAVQIEIDVDPLFDMEPMGDGNRRVRHRVCRTRITFRRNIAPPGTYSLECPCCGRMGDVQEDVIDFIDRKAIWGDDVPVNMEVRKP